MELVFTHTQVELNEEYCRNLWVVNNGKFNIDFAWAVVPSQAVLSDAELIGPQVLEAAQRAASYVRVEPSLGYVKVHIRVSTKLCRDVQ